MARSCGRLWKGYSRELLVLVSEGFGDGRMGLAFARRLVENMVRRRGGERRRRTGIGGECGGWGEAA